ncbi:hypothetical protein G9A89_009315 [Geosiphon pyriformis]|nr:hypothetical protein G9A89_009315 [Geosiphon pyriformis]
MRACISPEKEYETHTYYFCKACHKERFGYSKKSEKWDNTLCLTCEDILPEECNWINVAIRGGPAIQFKYFDNNGQGIKPEKAHKIDAEYNFRYLGKDTLVLQPKCLTKINFRIALKILPKAIVQIASQLLLANKGINVKKRVIDAEYTGDITIMLQNETDKPFKIEHAEKIIQTIYLLLINISGLQSVKNREQLRKSERKTQGFGSTGRFTVPVNIALNAQNESHQIFQFL